MPLALEAGSPYGATIGTEHPQPRAAVSRGRLVVRAGAVVGALAALSLAVAVSIAAMPHLVFAWRSPALHLGLETAITVVSLLAAYLLAGRYALTHALGDLVLVAALALLALSTLAFATVPALLDSGRTELTTWAPPLGGALGALGLAAAALLPDVRLPSPGRAAALSGTVALLAAAALATLVLGAGLPAGAGAPLSASEAPKLAATAGLTAIAAVALLAYGGAAVGFTLRAERTHDELALWLAVATCLAAGAGLHYLLFPGASPEAVLSGDLLRFASWLALLAGALRELRHHQRRLAAAAVAEERRRMARDLHDGFAQELAFISTQSRRLKDDPVGERVAHAAERALDESRSAIRALTRRTEDPFDSEVAEVAEQLAARAGARLRLDLQPSVMLPAEPREQLLRILREAVMNGLRHGKATQIAVELAMDGGVRLAVRDNGGGFDARGQGRTGGFGLTSMRERAADLGGTLEVFSQPGEGTVVEVVLP